MSEQAPVVITVRLEVEQLVVTGPARIVARRVTDHRVTVAIYPEPGTNVVREERR